MTPLASHWEACLEEKQCVCVAAPSWDDKISQ